MGKGKHLEAFNMVCELSSIELVGVTEPSSAKEDTIDSLLGPDVQGLTKRHKQDLSISCLEPVQ